MTATLNTIPEILTSIEAGVMTLSRNSLLITDPVKLVKIAGFDENYLHRRLRVAA